MGLDGEAPAGATQAERAVATERAVRCARCGHALTTEKERLEIAGRHRHTFMNPSGVIFEVALFRDVDGARVDGAPERDTSWFPDTAWVYAHCGSCSTQVGWSYLRLVERDGDDGRFFGLIVDAIST